MDRLLFALLAGDDVPVQRNGDSLLLVRERADVLLELVLEDAAEVPHADEVGVSGWALIDDEVDVGRCASFEAALGDSTSQTEVLG